MPNAVESGKRIICPRMPDPISKQSRARGVYAALATPGRPGSLEADTAALLDYLDAISSTGVDGVVLFGSTGEFIHFGPEERIRVVSLAIKRSRVPVLVNVSHSTLCGAVEIAENAVEAGAAGLLLTPPFFYAYDDAQIFEFYRQFLDQIGKQIPVYLYHLPMFVNPISPALAVRLLEAGAFAGIKDSSGDWDVFASLQAQHRKTPFQLLVGNEIIYLRGRSAGADGTISGVAAAVPELMVALDRSIQAGDMERAQALNVYLNEFVDQINRFPSTVAIKRAASARGWNLNHFAVPFDTRTAASAAAFDSWFGEWLARILPECVAAPAVRT